MTVIVDLRLRMKSYDPTFFTDAGMDILREAFAPPPVEPKVVEPASDDDNIYDPDHKEKAAAVAAKIMLEHPRHSMVHWAKMIFKAYPLKTKTGTPYEWRHLRPRIIRDAALLIHKGDHPNREILLKKLKGFLN